MDDIVLVSIVSLIVSTIVAGVGFILQYFGVVLKIKEDIASLKVKIDLFWTIVERDFPKILHSPHTPRFDFLLEAMESDTLARSDMKELYSLLNEEVVNSNPDYGRRLVAIVLMERLRQKIKAT